MNQMFQRSSLTAQSEMARALFTKFYTYSLLLFYVCHSLPMEVKGQLVGVGLFLPEPSHQPIPSTLHCLVCFHFILAISLSYRIALTFKNLSSLTRLPGRQRYTYAIATVSLQFLGQWLV